MDNVIDNYVKLEREKLEQEMARLQSARALTCRDEVHNVASPTVNNTAGRHQVDDSNRNSSDNSADSSPRKSSLNLANREYELRCESPSDDHCPATVLIKHREEMLSAGNTPVKSSENSRVSGFSPCSKVQNKVLAVKSSADLYNSSNEMEDEDRSKRGSRPTSGFRGQIEATSPRRNKEETMGEWITDSFYSHFPSFNIIEQKRKNLAKERHRECQEYLQKAASQKNNNTNSQRKLATPTKSIKNNKPASDTENNPPDNDDVHIDHSNNAETNPKSKLLQNLKHTWLINGESTIDETVDSAEIERQKKAEYQKQLLLQIDEKRKEVEELRRRQKLEEELLAKNLEEQLKTMQLEDELDKAKQQAEKVRLNIEQSQAMRFKLLENLKRDEQLLKQSEQKRPHPDNQVYRYFSNSSHRSDYNKYSRENLFETSDSESECISSCALSPVTPTNTCRYYNDGLPVISGNLSRDLCVPRSEDQRIVVCRSCDKTFNSLTERISPNSPNRNKFCSDCVENICIKRGKSKPGAGYELRKARRASVPLQLEHLNQGNSTKSFRVLDVNYGGSDQELRPDIDKRTLSNRQVENSIPPNVSIHQTNIKVIEQSNNEKLAKYLKNYGDISDSRSPTYFGAAKRNLEQKKNVSNIPLLRQTPKKRVIKIREEIIPKTPSITANVKKLSDKWEVPAVQKNIVSSSSGVLTQLGAFRKQLQIEKLELEKTHNVD